MIIGKQSWLFDSKPVIISSSAVGGPHEALGALAEDFDELYEDMWLGEDSYEKAEKKMMENACNCAVNKAGIKKEDVQFLLSGDLVNQIIPSSFSARSLGIPFFGIYGACSTSMEGLALAALMVDTKFAQKVLAATSSHNAVSEKQYRYPTEYGSQKPPTAQWTVTGSGAAVVSDQGTGPRISCATIGKIVDMGLSDPFNMGAAMAPAAVETIETHFKDLSVGADTYDLIVTGDLGRVGHQIAMQLFKEHDTCMPDAKLNDCGMMIYKPEQQVFSGGSGCGCAATTTYGHLLNRMRRGELKKILVVATGALLSPLSYQQKESIPCIAHAVCIEM